jgi:hypothetical protein
MQILDFREFLQRAERDRIEKMGKKDLFYRYLPYAIALGVVDNWSESFAGLHQEPPDWYDPAHGTSYRHATDFTHDFHDFSSSIEGAMTSSPGGNGDNGDGGGSSGAVVAAVLGSPYHVDTSPMNRNIISLGQYEHLFRQTMPEKDSSTFHVMTVTDRCHFGSHVKQLRFRILE